MVVVQVVRNQHLGRFSRVLVICLRKDSLILKHQLITVQCFASTKTITYRFIIGYNHKVFRCFQSFFGRFHLFIPCIKEF